MSGVRVPAADHPQRRPGGRGRSITPLYHRIYVTLLAQLRDGHFPPGEPMPSELQLADQYNVSRVTIRRTLQALERDGLIHRRRGSGTYPVEPKADAVPPRADIGGMLGNLITMESETEARTLSAGETRAPAWVRATGRWAGGPVFRIVRRRDRKGLPFSVSNLMLPPALGEAIDVAALGNEPVMAALERIGVIPTTAEQVLTVALAEPGLAAEVGVEVGAPLICMRRTVLDPKGDAILFQESFYPPDRYEYRMTLSRVGAGVGPRWMPVA